MSLLTLVKQVCGMSKDIVNVPNSTYSTGQGSFGIVKTGNTQWLTCRDQFQTYSESIESFIFVCDKNTQKKVISFMERVQQIINLPKENLLSFKKTNADNMICVVMGNFWKYKVRRSLLTALLRCGQSFEQDTGKGFEKALNSQPYTAKTKQAIERFFSGATAVKIKKNQGFGGWQAMFANKTPEQIKNMLVKLKKKKDNEEVINQE